MLSATFSCCFLRVCCCMLRCVAACTFCCLCTPKITPTCCPEASKYLQNWPKIECRWSYFAVVVTGAHDTNEWRVGVRRGYSSSRIVRQANRQSDRHGDRETPPTVLLHSPSKKVPSRVQTHPIRNWSSKWFRSGKRRKPKVQINLICAIFQGTDHENFGNNRYSSNWSVTLVQNKSLIYAQEILDIFGDLELICTLLFHKKWRTDQGRI